MRIFSAQGIAREGAPRYQVQTEEERYWQRREFIAGINIIGVRYAGDAFVYLPHDLTPEMLVLVKNENSSGTVTIRVE